MIKLLLLLTLKILLADTAREIFQLFLVQKSQKQGSEFLDLVYKFKQNYSQVLDFRPVTDQLDNSIYDSMVALCTKMEPPDKRIRAIITDADQDTLNGILMVSSYLHIPVIDIRRHFYANDPVSSTSFTTSRKTSLLTICCKFVSSQKMRKWLQFLRNETINEEFFCWTKRSSNQRRFKTEIPINFIQAVF